LFPHVPDYIGGLDYLLFVENVKNLLIKNITQKTKLDQMREAESGQTETQIEVKSTGRQIRKKKWRGLVNTEEIIQKK